MKLLKFLNRGFLNLLFPFHCAGCGERLSPGSSSLFFCRSCISQFLFHKVRIKPDTYAVCRYEGIAKKAIHTLKYGKKRFLAQSLGEILTNFYKENLDFERSRRIDFIVPVPLHRARERERGFNQAELIAVAICKNLNLPLSSNNLIRIRNTPSQTLIKKSERLKNLRGAFSIKRPHYFSKKNVLLVDDVYTTGATTDECRKVLKKAGSKKVLILTFAK